MSMQLQGPLLHGSQLNLHYFVIIACLDVWLVELHFLFNINTEMRDSII